VSADLPGSLAVRTGEPVIISGIAELERRFPLLKGHAFEDRSLICVPMRAGNRSIGVISLSFPAGRDVASRSELAFFTSLADSCGQAVDRSRALASLEIAVAKLSFLADATSELSSSLDYRTTLGKIATLVVPRLADWCAVDLVENGSIERVAVAHVDPSKVAYAEELQRRYPPDPDAGSGVPQVIRSGVSEHYPVITDEMLVAGSTDAEQLRVSRELGLRSALIVPLCGHSSTLGALSLVHAESGRTYNEDDLAFAEDIARRAAVAVENARAYEERFGQQEIPR
jgi:GAF domain-containing protein